MDRSEYVDVAELVGVVKPFNELVDGDPFRCSGTAGRVVVFPDSVLYEA